MPDFRKMVKQLLLTDPLVRIPLLRKSDILTILCIHGVTGEAKNGKTANFEGRHIHRDDFAVLLSYMLDYFNPISIEQLDGYYYGGEPLPGNPLLLTFDDGFANNYSQAFPILKSRRCPATVFLATGYIDNTAAFWVERLEYSISMTGSERLRVRIFDADFDLPLHTVEEKARAYIMVLNVLKKRHSFPAVDEAVRTISNVLGFPHLDVIEDNEDYRFLTWDNVREMTAAGVSFGAHTVNHVNLINEDIEKAELEIRASKDKIEKELGRECIAFCYPFGRSGYNSAVENLVKKTGLRLSFQLGGELNDRNTNPFLLNRIPIGWGSKKEDLLWHIVRI